MKPLADWHAETVRCNIKESKALLMQRRCSFGKGITSQGRSHQWRLTLSHTVQYVWRNGTDAGGANDAPKKSKLPYGRVTSKNLEKRRIKDLPERHARRDASGIAPPRFQYSDVQKS